METRKKKSKLTLLINSLLLFFPLLIFSQTTDPIPVDNAVDVAFNTDLSWQGSAATFYVWLWDDNSNIIVNNFPTTDNFFDIPDLSFETTYHWRVDAMGTGGLITGTDWTFTTGTPLFGIKTIGGNAPDYTNIETAINELNTRGIGPGGVHFLIRDGIYNENENLVIENAEASSSKPVIFQPDTAANVEININLSNGNNSAFKIYNSDYISFDGSPYGSGNNSQNMSINGINNNNDDSAIFRITNGSDYCSLKNLKINSIDGSSGTGFATPVYCSTNDTPTLSNNISFFKLENCNITGGLTYGIFLDGSTDKIVTSATLISNTIVNWQGFGIYLSDAVTKTNIEANEIYQTFTNASDNVCGINIGGGTSLTRFHHNYIHDLKHHVTASAEGIALDGASNGNLFYNNIVALSPGDQADTSTCMSISATGNGINNKIFNNTFYMGGTNTVTANSYCLQIANETAGHVVKNNILSNERIGTDSSNEHVALALSVATSCVESNFNFLSVGSNATTDNRYVAKVNNTLLNTLADLQNTSGYVPRDINSITGISGLNLTDFHLTSSSICIGKGIPVSGILTDFDYESRDASRPDIGADESNYTGIEGSVYTHKITIKNYPNPFNTATEISFNLIKSTFIKVEIVDLNGKLINTLLNKNMPAGKHKTTWNGENKNGRNVSSGLYFCRLTTSQEVTTKKLLKY